MLKQLNVNRPKAPQNPNLLRFLTSAADREGCPKDAQPEIALVGRSNAGKSSFINALANSRIAQVSNTPGKTRLLNFYQAPKYRWVDMPGYGFAARSSHERDDWIDMIEPFLSKRENLVGLLIIMDIRRVWSDDETNLLNWIAPRELPSAVVLTKADKISAAEKLEYVESVREESGLTAVLPTSTLKREGFAEVEEYVFKTWVKPRLAHKGVGL